MQSSLSGTGDIALAVQSTALLSGSEDQGACSCQRKSVRGMVRTVVHRHRLKIERADSFEACDIDTVLLGIRTPLVMGVDATTRAEVMLRGVAVELVEAEQFAALGNIDAVQIRRHCNPPTHATVRTVTTPRGAKPVGEPHGEPHSSAMARAFAIHNVIHLRLRVRYSDERLSPAMSSDHRIHQSCPQSLSR